MGQDDMPFRRAAPGTAARFSTTRWSVVLRAGGAASQDTQAALGDLIQRYWYPLYAFCRREGHSGHDAMDLTQGFFTHLMSGSGLESVSPEKGRFRSFLLASFKNYMSNQRRAAQALRRGGDAVTRSLNAAADSSGDFETRYDQEPAETETPESLFLRSWVHELLDCVKRRLAENYRVVGKSELFALLEPHLTHQPDALPRGEVGRRLNLSPAAVNMSIHRMRRAYGELLREEVAATVDDPADVENELRELLAVMGRTS